MALLAQSMPAAFLAFGIIVGLVATSALRG